VLFFIILISFGLTAIEIPGDEIVACKVMQLILALNMNRSTKDGYMLFISGSKENYNNN
jgi:hypothetical protein